MYTASSCSCNPYGAVSLIFMRSAKVIEMLKKALLCLSSAAFIGCAPTPTQTIASKPHQLQGAQPSLSALPAGLWMFEPVDATACIDCPSPRFVWVLAQGSSAKLHKARASWSKARLAPGYPFIATAQELGLPESSTSLVLIGGLYHDRASAEAEARGGSIIALPQRRADPSTRAITIVEHRLKAYEPSLRGERLGGLPEHGEPAAPLEVVCELSRGMVLQFNPAQLVHIPDAPPWVEIVCPGSKRAAMIPIHGTDLALTTQRRDDGVVQTLQPSGGACGVERFRLVVDGDKAKARELYTAPSCVEESVTESDPWGICDSDLLACVERARARAASGDAQHGLRLASYACRFGELEGCDVSATLAEDAHRALLPRIDACRRGDVARCKELDSLLARTTPERGRDHGMVAVIACQRGHKAWCEALKDSPQCDQDGCG